MKRIMMRSWVTSQTKYSPYFTMTFILIKWTWGGHTSIECKTPDGKVSRETFKVDTGTDVNLMPISMFMWLSPKVSLDTLSRMIERDVTLFAYSNTPIKQYGTCSIRFSFKGKSICRFFIVKHETAIVGITDSEKTQDGQGELWHD